LVDDLHSEGSTHAGEPPGILQEVIIPINMIIPGCNSDKKLIFFKKKSCNPLSESVSVRAGARKNE